MGRRVGAACSPDKVGSSRNFPLQASGVSIRYWGKFNEDDPQKASLGLPTILIGLLRYNFKTSTIRYLSYGFDMMLFKWILVVFKYVAGVKTGIMYLSLLPTTVIHTLFVLAVCCLAVSGYFVTMNEESSVYYFNVSDSLKEATYIIGNYFGSFGFVCTPRDMSVILCFYGV